MLREHHPRHHYKSTQHAWRGFYHTLTTSSGRNLRLEVALGALALILAYYFQFDMGRQMVVIATILLVIGFEMINTSLEEIVNAIHPERHPLAGAAKDAAAAAVLVMCVLAAVVCFYLYLPPSLALFY